MRNKKVLYVNYSPYENQGKILDFLISEYTYVFLISIGHHNIGKQKTTNKLTIYKNKKIIGEQFFFLITIPSALVFILLPMRSIISLVQVIALTYRLKKKFGEIDYYFTVNGYTAWIGLILRRITLVEKTVYWVCDYYPLNHSDLIIRIMRRIYWQFEKLALSTDVLAFHNMRLVNKWKEHGLAVDERKHVLVPIGTSREKVIRRNNENLSLCFLGVLKKSQGVSFIINVADQIANTYKNTTIHIIGPGPDMEYFKQLAKRKKAHIQFHGYVTEKEMDDIISASTIGLALYVPDTNHVSYYGDPGKIKKYISHGLPVIATNIHEFTEELKFEKAGIIVPYGDRKKFVEAVRAIMSSYKMYQLKVLELRKRYYYDRLYKRFFAD